jgi:hypothetical protein
MKHRFARDRNQNGSLLRSNRDSSKNHVGVLLVYKKPHKHSSHFRVQAFYLQTTILIAGCSEIDPVGLFFVLALLERGTTLFRVGLKEASMCPGDHMVQCHCNPL